jgi:hypothetical protein
VTCIGQGITPRVAGTDFDVRAPADGISPPKVVPHKKGRRFYFTDRNVALCPMGRVLYPGFHKKSNGHGVFYNSQTRGQCTCKRAKEARERRYLTPMSEPDFSKVFNDKNLNVKQVRVSPDVNIVRQRKSIAERPFVTLRRNMDAGYCLTKGFKNVRGGFSLAFLTYNLKRAINILGSRKMIECLAI